MSFARGTAEARRRDLLGCLLLLTFLVYANALANGFVYDDHSQIEQNPYVHSMGNIGKIFGTSLLSQDGKQAVGNYYRPLMNLDFLLCFKLFGSFPAGFHLINILLHCVVVWLVYAVAAALTSDEAFGLIAAVCFALHPIHTEPVSWIDGVADIEMTLFYLLAFWLFLRLGREEGRGNWLRASMLVSFLLATLSKEPAITLPAAATAYEHFCRADRETTNWKQKLSRYGGFWAVAFVYLVVRAVVLGGFAPARLHAEIGAQEAGLTGLALAGQYMEKLVWPAPLVAFYPFHRSASFVDSRVLLGAAVLIAVGALVVYFWKRERVYSFALLWIFVTLGPALNVHWMLKNVFAERYLYLPSVGFCWLASGAILWIWRRNRVGARRMRWALGIAVGLVGLLATGEIVARNRDWKDDHSIALSTLKTNPDSAAMRSDVAMAEWRSGNHGEAIRQWRLALAYNPDSAEALSGLGFAMVEEQKYAEATPLLQKAIERSPRFAMPHVYLGHAYAGLGKTFEAEGEFRSAAEIYPMNSQIRNALGSFYLGEGRLAEAETQFQASLAISANFESWSGLAQIYTARNLSDKAVAAWRQALALEPFDAKAHLNLGRIYLMARRPAEAEKEFDACLLMDPKNAEALAAMQKLRP